jgi:hypothetical protein
VACHIYRVFPKYIHMEADCTPNTIYHVTRYCGILVLSTVPYTRGCPLITGSHEEIGICGIIGEAVIYTDKGKGQFVPVLT